MLSKNLENSPSYEFFYKFWKKIRVYYTLSISSLRPPGFATAVDNSVTVSVHYVSNAQVKVYERAIHVHLVTIHCIISFLSLEECYLMSN